MQSIASFLGHKMHIINPYRYGGGPGTILVQDTFTDSDATDLESHTPDVGSAGTTVLGPWEIASNVADCTGGAVPAAPGYIHNWDCGQSDVDISVDYKPGVWPDSGHLGGLSLRYGADGNFYHLGLYNGDIIISEWNGTSFDVRDSATAPAGASSFNELRAVCNGSTIDGYFDGEATPRVTYSGATVNQTSTKFGIRVNRDDSTSNRNLARWDNLLIVQV
jgi:hypothetical protein